MVSLTIGPPSVKLELFIFEEKKMLQKYKDWASANPLLATGAGVGVGAATAFILLKVLGNSSGV